MYEFEITEQLKSVIEDYLSVRNIELFELTHRFEGKGLILRILADRLEGGITIEECADLNRDLSRIFDEKDLLQESYVLEVSSPGLDRPLLKKNDFLRCLNKDARFFFLEPVNNRLELEGTIRQVSDDEVGIEIDGQITKVSLSKIRKAKQIF